jgi:hypothetical protein
MNTAEVLREIDNKFHEAVALRERTDSGKALLLFEEVVADFEEHFPDSEERESFINYTLALKNQYELSSLERNEEKTKKYKEKLVEVVGDVD